MADVQDVANYIVYLGGKMGYAGMDNQLVNNLLFLCELEYSRNSRQTLIPHAHFVNGRYGPSDPRVIRRFESYGKNAIPAHEGDRWNLSLWQEQFIRDTVVRYMQNPASVFSVACQAYQMAEYEKSQRRRKKKETQEQMMFRHIWFKN